MKQKTTLILSIFLSGFLLGISLNSYLYEDKLASFIDGFTLSNVGETNINLSNAKLLREGKVTYMVEHFEHLVQSNVLIFTNHGKGLDDLNENDLCVFNTVKEYWIKECNRNCFPKLQRIFDAQNNSNVACNGNSQGSTES